MQAYIKDNTLIICDILENEPNISDLINNFINNGVKINPIYNVEGNISGIKISDAKIQQI